MKELSLNVLDVTKNSVTAGAKNISITLDESEEGMLTLQIADDGCGMSREKVESVTDPFFTTRTTRKVGLGIPLLKLAAEQTGGSFNIESEVGVGTTVTAVFDMNSIDFTPIGDMVSTLTILIMGSPEVDFLYRHSSAVGGKNREVTLSCAEIREVLGDVPLDMPEIIEWIKENLEEQYKEFGGLDK